MIFKSPDTEPSKAPETKQADSERLNRLNSMNPYFVLGVSATANKEEINEAAERLLKEFDPKTNPHFMAERICANIIHARDFLLEQIGF